MQWTKVSVKHAELIFSDASDSVFRTYVRLMLLTSSMEVAPTSAQLSLKLGKRKMESLEAYLKTKEISLNHIIDKVMEDVESVLRQREQGKVRQQKHRVTRDVTEQDKIREDKIREDKSNKDGGSLSKYKEIIDDLNTIIKKTFRVTPSVRDKITARFNEGFSFTDFKAVHRNQNAKWKDDDKMKQFLRP